MIVFRQTDSRYPFLWESADQPVGRWHGAGEGPAHYLADTPAGAWAEFLRHEEITEPEDLETIRRQMWAVDIGDAPGITVRIDAAVATGDLDSYPACQSAARRLRSRGASRLRVPSAALQPGAARGTIVRNGHQPAPARDGSVIVVFGDPGSLVGFAVAEAAQPPRDLLERVRHRGR